MLRNHYCLCVLCVLLSLALATALLLWAPQPAPAAPDKPVSFINDVAPILKDNCFACHDAKKRKGKLDMTTFENLRKGGGDGEDPIVPGNLKESNLYQLITSKTAKRMPPKENGEPLPSEKIAVIERWIRQGAKLDATVQPGADLVRELRIRWKPPAPPATYKYPAIVNALTFTPDGSKLIVGGYHELTVWDVAHGKLERRIRTRAERAYALAFLANGFLAVAGARPGQEGDLRIYNIKAGKPMVENGVPILDGVNDPGIMVKELIETDDSVLCLAVSADGKKLAGGGCDRLVRVWDLSAGLANPKLEQVIENHADWVLGVAFAPDGKHLLTASRDKTAKLWDLAAKESVLTFPDHQNYVFNVATSPDGKIAYSAGMDNMVRAWTAKSEGKQVRAWSGHTDAVVKVLHHPKKPLLVTCGHDKTVRIWNADNGQPVRVLSGHQDVVYALALTSDGNLIASGSWDGEVRVWQVAEGKLVRAFNASPGFQKIGVN